MALEILFIRISTKRDYSDCGNGETVMCVFSEAAEMALGEEQTDALVECGRVC